MRKWQERLQYPGPIALFPRTQLLASLSSRHSNMHFFLTHTASNSLKTCNLKVLNVIILIFLQNGRKAKFQSVSLVIIRRKQKKKKKKNWVHFPMQMLLADWTTVCFGPTIYIVCASESWGRTSVVKTSYCPVKWQWESMQWCNLQPPMLPDYPGRTSSMSFQH